MPHSIKPDSGLFDGKQDERPSDEINNFRRALMLGAGMLAAGWQSAEAETPAANSTEASIIDRSCRVSSVRLDELVAKAYPSFNNPVILPAFDAKTQGARFSVDLHRIVTATTIPETGERLKISGLLAVPVGAKGNIPLLSWQHGTIFSFGQVPSNLMRLADSSYELTDAADSLETLFNIQRFAGQGYAVIAADYIGHGPFRNGQSEPYLVKGATVSTCLGILEAGQSAMRQLGLNPSKLFLHGWSQGSLNTLWLHQALSAKSRPIAGTAVSSPFTDLNEAWRFWGGALTFPPPEGVTSYPELADWVSLCMIISLGSYERYYGLKGLMKTAIRPEYHDLAMTFWTSYQLDPSQIKSIPSSKNLLVPGLFERFTAPQNSAFLRRCATNRATYWAYDSPVRFNYGLADEAINPALVYPALAAGGPLVTGVPVPGGSHRGTFLAGLYGSQNTLSGSDNVLAWFNSLG